MRTNAESNDFLEQENLLTNMNDDNLDDVDIINAANMSIIDEKIATTEQLKTKVKSGFTQYSSKVNWLVFFSISIFTLGAWLDICAIWSELVYLVDELPEGWRLPSILNLISVLAQLGPLSFSVGRYLFPTKFTFVRAIYFIFGIGLLSCLFLALFWNKTEMVMHERRSIYLYIFNFTLSLLDGISTITFLPYIGENFSKEYIIPNYIGESLSSLVPGLFAILQSLGVKDECPLYLNSTLSSSNFSHPIHNRAPLLTTEKLKPNYSVSVYFIIMLMLLFCSTGAFTYLNYSKTARRARKHKTKISSDLNVSQIELVQGEEQARETNIHGKINKKNSLRLLFSLAFLGSFIQYGYLPGLLSYSTIPYGNIYFHLSINLSSVCLPLAIFFSIWSYEVSLKRIITEFLIAACFASYIIIISFQSPCPVFVDTLLGGYLIVISWIMSSCMFLRIRCLIATKLEKYEGNSLFIFGLATIGGQVLGGSIIFASVDVFHMFKDKPKCSPDFAC